MGRRSSIHLSHCVSLRAVSFPTVIGIDIYEERHLPSAFVPCPEVASRRDHSFRLEMRDYVADFFFLFFFLERGVSFDWLEIGFVFVDYSLILYDFVHCF